MSDFKEKLIGTFNSVADKTKEYAGKVSVKAKEYADAASDKAKDVAKIAKLTIEINGEKDVIKKAYSELGKLYYETYKDNPGGLFVQLCDDITLANESIAAKEAEIAELKAKDDKADDSIEVEFENIVAEAEEGAEAAEAVVEDAVKEAVEEPAVDEAIEKAVEEVVDAVADAEAPAEE